jgi:hypothetical protein
LSAITFGALSAATALFIVREEPVFSPLSTSETDGNWLRTISTVLLMELLSTIQTIVRAGAARVRELAANGSPACQRATGREY